MIKVIIKCLIVFSVISCQSQNNNRAEGKLEECVAETVNEAVSDKDTIDFYGLMLEVEKEMLASGMLHRNDEKSYLDLFENLKTKNSNFNVEYENIMELMENEGFDFNSYVINNAVFNECPYKIYKSAKKSETKLIYGQGKVLNKMMEQGYGNDSLLSELMGVTSGKDFDKIVYRAPVILLLVINLDEKNNPDEQNIENSKKGKTFLGDEK